MKNSTEEDTEGFGLLAFGASHGWEISIDEALDGVERWYAQIEGPSVSLSFQILDLSIVAKTIAFLDENDSQRQDVRTILNQESSEELTIGLFGRTSVSLIWDNEYKDRCFLIVGAKSRSTIRFSLFASELTKFREALQQLREDLPQEHP